jgi:ribosomal protein L37E
MIFDSENEEIASDEESPEWDAAVQEQHLSAERAAKNLFPSEIRKKNEHDAEMEKEPCPGCGLDLRVTYDSSMGQCTTCGHGNNAGRYD